MKWCYISAIGTLTKWEAKLKYYFVATRGMEMLSLIIPLLINEASINWQNERAINAWDIPGNRIRWYGPFLLKQQHFQSGSTKCENFPVSNKIGNLELMKSMYNSAWHSLMSRACRMRTIVLALSALEIRRMPKWREVCEMIQHDMKWQLNCTVRPWSVISRLNYMSDKHDHFGSSFWYAWRGEVSTL
jgi:hypothetical protein